MKSLKWILLTAALMVLTLTAVSGTLGDTKANSQYLGLIQSELMRSDSGLTDVADNRALLPGVYTALNTTDVSLQCNFAVSKTVGTTTPTTYSGNVTLSTTEKMYTARNALDHIVVVTNLGNTDGYVRTWFAFEMGDLNEAEFEAAVLLNKNTADWTWGTFTYGAEIDGQRYAVVCAEYKNKVAAGATTTPSLLQILLYDTVSNKTADRLDGNGDGKYEIRAYSQVVSHDGAWSSVGKPWPVPTTVSTAAELKDALPTGGMISVEGEIAVDSFGDITNGATIVDGTFSRDTASGNPLHVSTTETVTFEDVTFESVKGSAVLATRTDGANIVVNDCVFNNQAAPSTGNTGIQVYAKNVTMTFNGCTFNNMPIITNSSYPEGIKLVFNNCTFNWTGDNCPGFIQIANNLKITVDLNNCKMNYTTNSQYTTAKTMISFNWPEASTININGLDVVGTRNNDKIWKIASSNNKVTINTTGELSYTFNGAPVDFATYLK